MDGFHSIEMIDDILLKASEESGFVDRLKIRYRAKICPFSELLDNVSDDDIVGDVGCGSGQFLLLVRYLTKAKSVYGIEISDKLVNNANRIFEKFSLSGFYFETFSGIDYPEYISSCDVIFLIDVLHHVPRVQQKDFVFKLADKIKPGGRLIVKDIDASSRYVYFNKLHDLIFSREIGNEMSAEDVIELLKEAGLIIEKCKKQRMYVYPHFTIVARKAN